jgi:hypothetical protein
MTDRSGHVLRYDVATGTSTAVAGTGAPRGERIRIDW